MQPSAAQSLTPGLHPLPAKLLQIYKKKANRHRVYRAMPQAASGSKKRPIDSWVNPRELAVNHSNVNFSKLRERWWFLCTNEWQVLAWGR